jgi:putative endonuclease
VFYIYLLRCKDRSLYCGSTNNLANRLNLHNAGLGSAYVRSRGGGEIVYSEKFRTRGKALRREAEIKKWPKAKKEQLVKPDLGPILT